MKSVDEFLWQAMKFQAARKLVSGNWQGPRVSDLQLWDESVREAEYQWVDNEIDIWIFAYPFRVFRYPGSMSFVRVKQDHAASYTVGSEGIDHDAIIDAWENRAGPRREAGYDEFVDPRLVPSHLYDVKRFEFPVAHLVPGFNYDALKVEIREYGDIGRRMLNPPITARESEQMYYQNLLRQSLTSPPVKPSLFERILKRFK